VWFVSRSAERLLARAASRGLAVSAGRAPFSRCPARSRPHEKRSSEAHIPAEQPQAGEDTRLPSPHVYACRAGDHKGSPPPWSPPPVSLSRTPLPVRGHANFAALAATRRRARSGPVAVHFVPCGTGDAPRVAYAVGRKFGGAVERNRCRRRLRALAGELAGELAPGDYLVGAGRGAQLMTFRELRERVFDAMRRASRMEIR